ERYLSPEGERIDASVRSRLALDGALLAREIGDAAAFESFLSRAVALDITNKDAASVALRLFEERGGRPRDLLQLQVNLLYADPLDPHVYRSMARALAREGAYAQALRMAVNAQDI